MAMAIPRNLSNYELHEWPVSNHVMEVLQLEFGDQNRLVVIQRIGANWSTHDPVMLAARALKYFAACIFVMKGKFCYDEADQIVYWLAHTDLISEYYRGYDVHVGEDFVTFYQVKSIVRRPLSAIAFSNLSVRIKANRSACTLEEDVSLFVIENLELVVGDQSRLLAVTGLSNGDLVKLVARVVKQNHGQLFLHKYKFCMDYLHMMIYVLALDAEDAALMAGRSFIVDSQELCFYRVLNIEKLSALADLYQSYPCNLVWPVTNLANV